LRPSLKTALALLFALAVALALATAFTRSTIPRALSGKVDKLELASGGKVQEIRTHVDRPTGGNDYFLLTVNEHRIVVDRGVASILRPGDRVSKKRFSRTLIVNGEPQRLHLSRDFHHMLVAYLLLGLLLVLALVKRPPIPSWPPVLRRKRARAE
jgi:hypothetical protein